MIDTNTNTDTDTNEPIKKYTIQDYLESKDKLLTAFGVFIALTLFAGEIKIDIFSKLLSFIFLTISILIWLELWTSFPSKNRSWTVIIFESLLTLVTLGIIGYWIFAYRSIWKYFAFFCLFAGISTAIAKLMEKYGIYDRIFKRKVFKGKLFRTIFGMFIIAVIVSIAFILSALIIGGITPLLDMLETDIIKEVSPK